MTAAAQTEARVIGAWVNPKTEQRTLLRSTGDAWVDRAIVDVLEAKARHGRSVAEMRAIGLMELAERVARAFAERDARIAELEAEVATLTERAGGADAVSQIDDLEHELKEMREERDELRSNEEATLAISMNAHELATLVLRRIGLADRTDDSIETYQLRRIAEDVLR